MITYGFGATVDWDRVNRAAIITGVDGETHVIVIEEVGGFIENGVSWVPLDFVEEVLVYLLTPTSIVPPNDNITGRVDRVNLTIWDADNFEDIREATHSTDLPHGAIAVYYIEYMNDNLGARSAFTYRELETAIWIVEELLAMGHDWDAIYVQEFTYWCVVEMELGVFTVLDWNLVTSPFILGVGRDYQLRPDRVSQNVILTLPGQSESKIIVGAHYDSPPYPSASDNASGTALLLESAQRMLELEHYYTIVYVFFGAEEVGLIGAYYYYESLTQAQRDNILMMVNADVLIEGPYIIYGSGAAPNFDDIDMDELIEYFIYYMMDYIIEDFEMAWAEILADLAILGIDDPSTIILPFDSLEGFIELVIDNISNIHPYLLLIEAAIMGILEPIIDPISQQVTEIAAELTAQHDFELISIPGIIGMPSDQLVFLFEGHRVVNLVGLEREGNLDPEIVAQLTRYGEGMAGFTATILHSPLDEFSFIEYLWPGMILANLEAFSLLLEEILTGRFS